MHNILFICALAVEKQALIDRLGDNFEVLTISAYLNFTLLKYPHQQRNIFITESGMGGINASIKLALILEQLSIDQIILLGVGGALHHSLNIGDMIITDKVIQHDYYSSLASGNYLMRPGELILSEPQTAPPCPIIQSTTSAYGTALINSAKQHPSIRVIEGLIASGSEFVGTEERKNTIHQQAQQALLVDMEAAAVAVVASQYQCPFMVAKTVSDRLHSDANASIDFSTFLTTASRNAAEIAMLIIISDDHSEH
ncbi:MAG: hypothetical protein OFPII_33060 [Osedax symbiont Rs1]|nr:MAG: hypothetical protein OFPII_33060 [Osedax symbiont Rs1]